MKFVPLFDCLEGILFPGNDDNNDLQFLREGEMLHQDGSTSQICYLKRVQSGACFEPFHLASPSPPEILQTHLPILGESRVETRAVRLE